MMAASVSTRRHAGESLARRRLITSATRCGRGSAHPAGGASTWGGWPGTGEALHDFGEKKRMAFGALVHGGPQRRIQGETRGVVEETRDLGLREPVQGHGLASRGPRERAQRLTEGMTEVQGMVTVGPEDQHRRGPKFPHEKLQEEQRGGIGPVQIVEEEHEGLRVRDIGEEGGEPIKEVEPGVRRLEGRRDGQLGQAFAHVGDHLRNLSGTTPEGCAQGVRVARLHIGADDLHPRPEGRRPFPCITVPGIHPGAPLLGLCG